MFDGCEYSDLIERVLLLSVGEVADLNLLESVLQAVLRSFDLVDTRVGAVT